MNKRKVTEIYETESAKRFRLEYFPFFDLVDVRRSIVTPSYNPLYYRNIKFYRLTEKQTGTGADQIVIYTLSDKNPIKAPKSGYVVIENLYIREVTRNGE